MLLLFFPRCHQNTDLDKDKCLRTKANTFRTINMLRPTPQFKASSITVCRKVVTFLCLVNSPHSRRCFPLEQLHLNQETAAISHLCDPRSRAVIYILFCFPSLSPALSDVSWVTGGSGSPAAPGTAWVNVADECPDWPASPGRAAVPGDCRETLPAHGQLELHTGLWPGPRII